MLSVAMNNAGFDTVHEEGHFGQFEIFRDDESYMQIDTDSKADEIIDNVLGRLFSMEVPLSG